MTQLERFSTRCFQRHFFRIYFVVTEEVFVDAVDGLVGDVDNFVPGCGSSGIFRTAFRDAIQLLVKMETASYRCLRDSQFFASEWPQTDVVLVRPQGGVSERVGIFGLPNQDSRNGLDKRK